MSLADQWHDPEGPFQWPREVVNAQTAVDFIHRIYQDAVDERLAALNGRFIEAARAAGLSEEWIESTLSQF